MKVWHKGLAALSCAAMLTGLMTGTALAAEEREKITRVNLVIDSGIEIGDDSGDVSVTTEDSSYRIDEVEVTNDDGDWQAGDQPRVKVTLEANDGFYFSSSSSSTFRFSGETDADFVSASRRDSNTSMTVTFKLEELVGTLEIESAQWEDDISPIATWEDGNGAKSYQVRLYRGSSSVTEAFSTTGNSYNFTSYFTRTGEYFFRVRAIGSKSSQRGEWLESDSFYVDEDVLSRIQSGYYGSGSGSNQGATSPSQAGGWQQDHIGWWYRNANGTYTTNGWQLINNVWYCFDSVGYMRTGWIQSAGVWYYCDASGAMLTNTRTPDGYWVDASGVWVQ